MLKTPLHSFHLDHKGHMVEFAGWDMPLYYSSIMDEHKQCRTSGALFDVSHMGRVVMQGRDAARFLERICTRRIGDMQPGQCRYSLVCNEQGGVHDDVIVYRRDVNDFLVVVNASNRAKLLGHFEKVRSAGGYTLTVDDQTERTAMIALQGPKIIPLATRMAPEVGALKRYRFLDKNLVITTLTISRTGYTGEDGVEIILPAGAVGMAMKLLGGEMDPAKPDATIRPCGLGARDTLRIEAGMPLYGHELGEDIPATSCGVDFAISMDKDRDAQGEPFIGLPALRAIAEQGGPARRLVGLEIEGKRAARQGMAVRKGDSSAGVVSSGCFSPTLAKSIAMAFVDAAHTAPGTALSVDTGKGATLEARVVPLPFYKAGK